MNEKTLRDLYNDFDKLTLSYFKKCDNNCLVCDHITLCAEMARLKNTIMVHIARERVDE